MSISATKRRRIFLRDGEICFYCGRTLHLDYPFDHQNFQHPALQNYMAVDHLDPQRDGGDHGDDNLVACCRSCNSSKGGRSLEAYRDSLELRHPWVQAREALRLARSLAELPQDQHILEAIEFLDRPDLHITFPGEKRRREQAGIQLNAAGATA